MRTEHELKLHTSYFNRVATNQKRFEIRKNDRDYQVGDVLILREFDGQQYVDYSTPLIRQVTYISTFAQREDYVVMGIEPLPDAPRGE